MAQGIRTSGNDVYVLDFLREDNGTYIAKSKSLDVSVVIEQDITAWFLQGREIKRYQILHSGKMVIIPYRLENQKVVFVSSCELKSSFPHTFEYLLANKDFLENRERGRMKGSNWYAFIYPKNIEIMRQPKILVPDIADKAQFAFDEFGEFSFTSGYGITFNKDLILSPKYILGLLNSKTLDFYLKKISTPMQNGFFRYFTQFIEQLPIRLN